MHPARAFALVLQALHSARAFLLVAQALHRLGAILLVVQALYPLPCITRTGGACNAFGARHSDCMRHASSARLPTRGASPTSVARHPSSDALRLLQAFLALACGPLLRVYFARRLWRVLSLFCAAHLAKKTTGYFIAETAKGYVRAPFITRKRPVPRGNTAPARSIGWVPAPAPFPTSERGHDSQRDR